MTAATTTAPTCRWCRAEVTREGGLVVDVLSGDEGGTYDYCPFSPNARHAAPYLAANRGDDYGAPKFVATPPGTGPVTCPCGNHRARCRFGRMHSWATWHYQGPLVRTPDTYACTCGAVCVAEETADA